MDLVIYIGYIHIIFIQKKTLAYFITATYVKTSVPHPAIEANIRGARSLAGLIAKPQLSPNAVPIA